MLRTVAGIAGSGSAPFDRTRTGAASLSLGTSPLSSGDGVIGGAPKQASNTFETPQARSARTKVLKINIDLALYRARVARRQAMRTTDSARREQLLSEAEETLQKCIAMDRTDGRGYVSLGKLLVMTRRYADAEALYEEGCTITGGQNAYLWTAWANLAGKRGEVSRARKLYDAATVADDKHAAAWHGWGLLEKRQGNFLAARDIWLRGMQKTRASPNPYLYQSLALLAAELGRTDEARKWFDAGTRTYMGAASNAMWHAWALLEARSGDPSLVRRLFRRGLEAAPRSRYIYLSWALWESQNGLVDNAWKLLQRGHELNQTDPAILQAWALLEEQQGRAEEARKLFQKGVEADPKHLYLWQAWGVFEFRAGRHDEARRLFRQGVWADPGSRDVALVFQAWAVLERSEGNYNAARELFKAAVKADPKSTPSWLAWAMLEEEQGRYLTARELRSFNLQETSMQVVLPAQLLGDPSTAIEKETLADTLARWAGKFGVRAGAAPRRQLPTLSEMGVRDGLQLTSEFLPSMSPSPMPASSNSVAADGGNGLGKSPAAKEQPGLRRRVKDTGMGRGVAGNEEDALVDEYLALTPLPTRSGWSRK